MSIDFSHIRKQTETKNIALFQQSHLCVRTLKNTCRKIHLVPVIVQAMVVIYQCIEHENNLL